MKILPLLICLPCMITACDPESTASAVDAGAHVRDVGPADMSVVSDMSVMNDMQGGPVDGGVPDAEPPECARWPGAPWTAPIHDAPLHPRSAEMIAWLRAQGGWGNRDRFQIDFSIEVLTADDSTPRRAFVPTGDFYSPDCDQREVPVPPGGALEGEADYRCSGDGDCHLIVYDTSDRLLYEMWRAHIDDDGFRGGCLAVWDTTARYGQEGRGEQCTSADAAGLPIAPLLFSADEVANGAIDHAIRFILPNDRIRHRSYVRPATHATGAASGGELAPPYGARLRLRADYPIDTLSPNARVVAQALQRYGMILADGGQIALTAQSDRFTDNKWAGLLGPHDLNALQVEDFEVADSGDPLHWSGDCVRAEAPSPCR